MWIDELIDMKSLMVLVAFALISKCDEVREQFAIALKSPMNVDGAFSITFESENTECKFNTSYMGVASNDPNHVFESFVFFNNSDLIEYFENILQFSIATSTGVAINTPIGFKVRLNCSSAQPVLPIYYTYYDDNFRILYENSANISCDTDSGNMPYASILSILILFAVL
jgi:hypothetical protein